jgi:hypothetical protein
MGKLLECEDAGPCERYPAMELVDEENEVWELKEPWCVDLPGGNRPRRLRIQKGYRTDGASIPRAAWCAVGHPLCSSLLRPGLAHDALYSAHLLSKAQSDKVLYDMVLAGGANWLKARAIWSAVSMFGGPSWRDKNRKAMAQLVGLCLLPLAKKP